MDMQALLNSIASGPPPAIPTGVNRVPVPQITLPGIGQVPIPVTPGAPGGPVVPGQPLPQAAVPAANTLGNAIPPGVGNVIGQPGPPSTYRPTALGTQQIAGPRGDRTLLSNLPVGSGTFYTDPNSSFGKARAALGVPIKPPAAAAPTPAGPTPQQKASTTLGIRPTPVQQHMAASTGYTGGFAPGQYESWLSAQPPAIRQAAHTAFGQAAMAAPPSPPPSQRLGSLLAPRAGAAIRQQPSAAARYNRWR